MKILLIKELSSLHRNLKIGLQRLGHEVMLAADGDGWKKIGGADIPLLQAGGKNLGNRIIYDYQLLKNTNSLSGFDVVQLVESLVFPALLNGTIVHTLKNNNGILSLVSAGGDRANIDAYLSGVFEYYAWDFYKEYIKKFDKKSILGRIRRKGATDCEKFADIIIPIMYEYSIGYENEEIYRKKLTEVIPFGLDFEELNYTENVIKNGKVVFFHGINNEPKKGTPFIREALVKLKENYPNDVEIIIEGKMPYNEYIDVMKRANVVIDQCCCHGYGINGGIAMAQGKIMMAGVTAKSLEALKVDSSPIIMIRPNVTQIYNQLEILLEERQNITQRGYDSRCYVEKNHDCVNIAARYIEHWSKIRK